jgi:hypothetical protein
MKRLFCCNSLGQTDPVEPGPPNGPVLRRCGGARTGPLAAGVALLRKARPRARDQQARMNFVADGPN